MLTYCLVLATVLQTPHAHAAPDSSSNIKVVVLKAGKGPAAAKNDIVTLDYVAKLANGTVFDQTTATKTSPATAPFIFTIGSGDAVKGLDLAMIGAKAGSKLRITIPPELGYGSRTYGSIPANSTLVFDVNVLGVVKHGVKQMIEFKDLAPGDGKSVASGDTVSILYTGTLQNGVQFDSNRNGGSLFTFKVGAGQVIKGFDMGVTGMKKGGRRTITIPPDLGYGGRGAGSAVPPNATLIFDIEVVEIK